MIEIPQNGYLITPPCSFNLREGLLLNGKWNKYRQPFLVYYGQGKNLFPHAIRPKWLEDNERLYRYHAESLKRCTQLYGCANGHEVPCDKELFDRALQKIVESEVEEYTHLRDEIEEELEAVVNSFEIGRYGFDVEGGLKEINKAIRLSSTIHNGLLNKRKELRKKKKKLDELIDLKKMEILTDKDKLQYLNENLI